MHPEWNWRAHLAWGSDTDHQNHGKTEGMQSKKCKSSKQISNEKNNFPSETVLVKLVLRQRKDMFRRKKKRNDHLTNVLCILFLRIFNWEALMDFESSVYVFLWYFKNIDFHLFLHICMWLMCEVVRWGGRFPCNWSYRWLWVYLMWVIGMKLRSSTKASGLTTTLPSQHRKVVTEVRVRE